MRTHFVLDALEQALFARTPLEAERLLPHSDRGSQYVSIRYSDPSGRGWSGASGGQASVTPMSAKAALGAQRSG